MTRIVLSAFVALAAVTAGCAGEAATAPYRPAATLEQLMVGPIAHAAERYWDAVQTIVDENGTREIFPRTDEEWESAWADALAVAESGNLLMMPAHARDGEWMTLAARLVEEGLAAARAAESRDRTQVLDAGNRVYRVCAECHRLYIPES